MVAEDITPASINDDRYLKPVLDDDAVILGLFDLPETTTTTATPGDATTTTTTTTTTADSDVLARNNAELREDLARVTAQFESYRAAVQQTLDQRWGDVVDVEADAKAVAEADRQRKGEEKERKEKGKKGEFANPDDGSKYYWESYAGVGKCRSHSFFFFFFGDVCVHEERSGGIEESWLAGWLTRSRGS